jgi:predicted nucleic acid-binding Zn ribbon protein
VFHPAGIVFKGSGFYATDTRSKSGSKAKSDGDDGGGGGTAKKKEERKGASAPETSA